MNRRQIGRDKAGALRPTVEPVDIGREPRDATAGSRCSIASSSSLDAFSAATFSALS
jgi:hypothetical protein